jgi:hypothetical protein
LFIARPLSLLLGLLIPRCSFMRRCSALSHAARKLCEVASRFKCSSERRE